MKENKKNIKVTFEVNENEKKEIIINTVLMVTAIKMARRKLEKMGYIVGECVDCTCI